MDNKLCYEVTDSKVNKDIPDNLTIYGAKQYYLDLYGDFESKLPAPSLYPSKERDDIFILDFAKGPVGLKAYGAEKLIATTNSNLLGYAAPRTGHASEAIAYLAEQYNKKVVFFAAASKQVTAHQAVVTCFKTSELRFVKIPAMPCLNSWIKNWANNFNGIALPFGLANTPLVTAGLIKTFNQYSEPSEFYCAVSTGTMIRALQIAWPNAKAIGVAVARNIKDGEKGYADVASYHKTFYQKSDYIPQDLETTTNYDAKAYKTFIDNAKPGAVFINVGADSQIEKRLSTTKPDWQNINSIREWGDQSAFATN